jgi:tetratricopeptide (TPR) repeat protein
MIEEQRGNYIKSEQYTRLAIQLLEKMNMQAGLHRASVNLGWCLYNRSLYPQSIKVYEKELSYYETVKDVTHVSMLYRMTGRCYGAQGYEDSAFFFYQRNDQMKKMPNDLYGIIYSPGFKGDTYLEAGDTAMAISFYLQSIDSAKAKKPVISHDYTSMFAIYELRHQYDSALVSFNQTLNRLKSNTADSFVNRKNLAIVYLQGCDCISI